MTLMHLKRCSLRLDVDLRDLSIEQLLGEIDINIPKIRKRSSPRADRTVYLFIKDYKLTQGAQRVPNYYLYYLYRVSWSPQRVKLSQNRFFKHLKLEFKTYRSNHQRYYLVDGITIDSEMLRKAHKYAHKKEEMSHPLQRPEKIKKPKELDEVSCLRKVLESKK